MFTFVDLPGKPGLSEAVGCTSVSDALAQLRAGKDITGDGSWGCINVYAVPGGYRCLFQRFLRHVDSSEFKYLASVHQWLKDWWPKMKEATNA